MRTMKWELQRIQSQNLMQHIGQSRDDWQQQVDTMQKKNASMREALAKVWGMEEGRNPFADNQLPKKEKKR